MTTLEKSGQGKSYNVRGAGYEGIFLAGIRRGSTPDRTENGDWPPSDGAGWSREVLARGTES